MDPDNPRLSQSERGASQAELLRLLLQRFKLEELGESMVSSGFLEFDPIVGFQNGSAIVVLEGNRRVATLKLLLRPELAPTEIRGRWQALSSRLGDPGRSRLEEINVLVFPDRTSVDVSSYIGFRHVTGVLPWPALEKASFIAELVEKSKWSYRQVAERLGSYPKHIERHYVAFRIIQQALDDEMAGAAEMRDKFGVLLRALQASGIPDFLSVQYPGNAEASKRPVPETHLENLRNFVRWTFGTKDEAKVIKDSRDLTKWGKILQSSASVSYMKRTPRPDFERAWLKSGGQVESLVESLFTASDRLEECVPLVAESAANDEVQDAVKSCSRFFSQILRHFPDLVSDFSKRVEHA